MAVKKKKKGQKVDTIEGVASMVAVLSHDIQEHFEKIDERFEKIDERFGSLESEMRSGFEVVNRKLDRIETRTVNLERAVFGGAMDDDRRDVGNSLLARIAKLERAVFKK